MKRQLLFLAGLLFTLLPFVSPPVALVLGLLYGSFLTHPFPQGSRRLSKALLQICVVGLGFGMDVERVLQVGCSGFLYTTISIIAALGVGMSLGKLLKVPRPASFLISVGTAICGGSAIAAVGPAIEANDEEMTVALGTVFLLNSVALLTFPSIGAAFGLNQTQFGLWGALAIHDTSSVVGASAKYGTVALFVGTTVKLARALWIIPITVGAAAVRCNNARPSIPWFIGLFIIAALTNI